VIYSLAMFRKTTLQNGLRVVTEHLVGTKAVTVLVLVGAGSRYEDEKIRGLSHFLEHMFFKGAVRYKNTKEVSEAIDSVGGAFNAFTGKEYTGYYVKVSASDARLAVDVLSDMLINSKFDQAEIEKESGVILEEYNMYQDTPMYQIGWNFERLLFGDQPLGWDQIGLVDVIKSVGHDDFVDYSKKLYTPDNIVVSIVGNIENEEAVSLVQEYFDMPDGEKAFTFEPLQDLDGGRINVQNKRTEQAHIAIGFPAYSEGHPDLWAEKVLAILLGGNMSSRMFLGVREAKGLAYSIHTSTENYMDTGAIVTNAGVDLNRIDDAISGIVHEYSRILIELIPEDEVLKAKSYLKGKMILGLEDSEEFAHLLAKYELLQGNAKSPDEIMRLVDAVTVEDVARVAKDLFVEDKLKLAVIGPYDEADAKDRFLPLLKMG